MSQNKLIKLSDTHYIIVDNSEMLPDAFIYDFLKKEVKRHSGTYRHINYINKNCKRITHSNKPFREFAPLTINDMGLAYIPLLKIEEAVYGYSVEKMSRVKYRVQASGGGLYTEGKQDGLREGYVDGFNAHKELTKDKLFTLSQLNEAIAEAWNTCEDNEENETYSQAHKRIIQSLLPKTEWDIEFDEQGKIKLI